MLQPNDLSIFGHFADALENSWRSKALPHQIEPEGDWWTIWALIAGRGAGKTRAGAEWVLEQIAAGRKRLALIAPTAADARDVMVEGESGILVCAPEWNCPVYEPSKRRLTWPNGAMATTYSAEESHAFAGLSMTPHGRTNWPLGAMLSDLGHAQFWPSPRYSPAHHGHDHAEADKALARHHRATRARRCDNSRRDAGQRGKPRPVLPGDRRSPICRDAARLAGTRRRASDRYAGGARGRWT